MKDWPRKTLNSIKYFICLLDGSSSLRETCFVKVILDVALIEHNGLTKKLFTIHFIFSSHLKEKNYILFGFAYFHETLIFIEKIDHNRNGEVREFELIT